MNNINSTPIYNNNGPESGHRGNIPHHNNVIYDKPTANIILNSEKLKDVSSKIRNTTGMSILTTSIQHSFGILSHGSQ